MTLAFLTLLAIPTTALVTGAPASDHDLVWSASDRAWVAPNGGSSSLTSFDEQGVRIVPSPGATAVAWEWGMTLQAYGRIGDSRPTGACTTHVEAGRIEFRREELLEWYVNDHRGLEHGFTIRDRIAGCEPLELALGVSGDLTAQIVAGGRDAVFRSADGRRAVSYSGLLAWDADGRELPVQLASADGRLLITVDDQGARYPLTIDPLILVETTMLAQPLVDAAVGDYFGQSVATDDDIILVGAEEDSMMGTNAGAAYFFVRNGTSWDLQGKVAGSDTDEWDRFGFSAAIDDGTAVVGANWWSGQYGRAYVFVRNGNNWTQQGPPLSPSDLDSFWHFAESLAIQGDRIVVGATQPGWPMSFTQDHGAAYVFERTGQAWSETAILRASDGIDYDHLGRSVAVDGDTIVAGATGVNLVIGEYDYGAAYVFTYDGSTWNEAAKLMANDGSENQVFGSSVDLEGETLVVGAPGDNENGFFSGAVYVYTGGGTTWIEAAKLTPSDGAEYARFGASVDLDGDRLLIGAPEYDYQESGPGAAYVFRRSGSTWVEQAKLVPSNGQDADHFGGDVAMFAEERAVVGAPFGDPQFWLPSAGAAYVYVLLNSVSNYCETSPNSVGDGTLISASGTLGIAANDAALQVVGAPANQFGVFYYGAGQTQMPFGNGLACVGGSGVYRLNPSILTGTDGTTSRTIGFTEPPASAGPGQIHAGSSWNFQFWYRDPAGGGAFFNLSDAVRLTFGP